MTFSDIVQFLLYVIPGFISIELFRSRFPAKTRTDFFTISWSIVFGVAVTSLLIWLDANGLHGLLAYELKGLPSIQFIASLVVAGLLIGIMRVGLRELRLLVSRRPGAPRWLTPDVNSIWARVNQTGTEQWAVAFLDDDVQYLGYIKYFRNDPDEKDQDFLLAEAFRVDKNRRVIYKVNGVGVYLNTRDVRRIEFLDSDASQPRIAKRRKVRKRST